MMYMLMYSLMSPVGIGIGTVIDIGVEHQHGSSYHATVGVLQVKVWSKDLYSHNMEDIKIEFDNKYKINLKMVSFLGSSRGYSFVPCRV